MKTKLHPALGIAAGILLTSGVILLGEYRWAAGSAGRSDFLYVVFMIACCVLAWKLRFRQILGLGLAFYASHLLRNVFRDDVLRVGVEEFARVHQDLLLKLLENEVHDGPRPDDMESLPPGFYLGRDFSNGRAILYRGHFIAGGAAEFGLDSSSSFLKESNSVAGNSGKIWFRFPKTKTDWLAWNLPF